MIEKITTVLSQFPPNWMSRGWAARGRVGSPEAEMRKLLGEPLPGPLSLKDLPREIVSLFGIYGMLEKIKRKLEWISRRRGNKIIPAKNTIACVDSEDNIYMGVDFLARYHTDEDLVAGIMAHEWGHMLSELAPGTDLSHLNWDRLFELRREEEAGADAFAGRALFQMGYEVETMIEFIRKIDAHKKVNTHKYHPAEVRTAILLGAFQAQKETLLQMKKFFGERSKIIDPSESRLIAVA